MSDIFSYNENEARKADEKRVLDELLKEIEGFTADDDFEQRQKIQQERFEKIVEPTLTEAQKEAMKQPIRPGRRLVPNVQQRETEANDALAKGLAEREAARQKKMSRCTKFLLFVVLPISAPLLLMVTAMALVEFFHIYLDFLRPFWIQLPSAPLYSAGLALPGSLVVAYISCRMYQRELRQNK